MIKLYLHIPHDTSIEFINCCNQDNITATLIDMTESSYCYELNLEPHNVHKLFYLGWTFGINNAKSILK